MVISHNDKSAAVQPPFVNRIEYTPQLIVRGSTGTCPSHK